MTRRSSPRWRLRRRARAASWGNRESASFVDVERDALHVACGLGDAVEVGGLDFAAPDAVGGDLGLFRDDARRQLFR